MSLFSRIARKISRRFRKKGSLSELINRPNRNWTPITAVTLWERRYRFQETPAARLGEKRQIKREAMKRRKAREGLS